MQIISLHFWGEPLVFRHILDKLALDKNVQLGHVHGVHAIVETDTWLLLLCERNSVRLGQSSTEAAAEAEQVHVAVSCLPWSFPEDDLPYAARVKFLVPSFTP